MGKECLNWLHPGHFHCTLKGCDKQGGGVFPLGYFNNLSRIISHYQTHAADGHVCAKAYIARHQHMIKCNEVRNDGEKMEVKKYSRGKRILRG